MRVLVLRAAIGALVLALGIAIGAGPLQEDHDRRARALAAQQEKLADRDREIDALNRSAQFSDAYAAATASRLVRGALTGRTVAIVQLPGADPAAVAAFRELIADAGGEVTADVPLSQPLGATSERQLVGALTSQMATQENLVMPTGGSGYERFGALLARAIGIPPSAKSRQAPYDETALGIVSGFQTAELVDTAAAVTRRASLTLVVSGPEASGSGETDIFATILRAYAEKARVVVSGPTGAARPTGVLGLLRATGSPDGVLSTVDTGELAGGRVAGVLAMAAQVRGVSGSYGGTDAEDGAVPELR